MTPTGSSRREPDKIEEVTMKLPGLLVEAWLASIGMI
jgi:hypothetical protein